MTQAFGFGLLHSYVNTNTRSPIMEFDSPDVEKDFPGLYASESGLGRQKTEDDFSEAEHEKISKKELLLGRRKDKKDKKDRGYATLDGESSPEEDLDMKSPSKTKKSKAFKFASSKKEKREKSRDKDSRVDVKTSSGMSDKEVGDSAAASSGTLHKEKKKDKDKKEKKDKTKDKEKKDKKTKHCSASEEILELGDAQPIFGVSLGLAVVRSRCHDNVNLPLVIRDCIDYLQEHGLASEAIYKLDASKTRLQQLKRTYNNRESIGTTDWDVPTACGMLKLFFKELPEPILTTDLSVRFEEAASLSEVTQQQTELMSLVQQLPSYNRTLLAWTLRHFDEVIQHEATNKTNAQNLAVLLSPTLQMSHRLFVCVLCHCSTLFEDTLLHKYVPPITATSPNLPETSDEITEELRKQDSLLNQIHAEMNAGFVTKKREEQLWEVQRIITQLKRKLRSFEKKNDPAQKSLDDTVDGDLPSMDLASMAPHKMPTNPSCSEDESVKTTTIFSTESTTNTETKTTPQATPENIPETVRDLNHDDTSSTLNPDQMYVHESGILMVPSSHPECLALLRLQLENIELAHWKSQLKARINAERSDLLRLKELLKSHETTTNSITHNHNNNIAFNSLPDGASEDGGNYERIVQHYQKENALLEQKKQMLVREVFEENIELIEMQVELAVQNFKY